VRDEEHPELARGELLVVVEVILLEVIAGQNTFVKEATQ
jgi:hypothetical protein